MRTLAIIAFFFLCACQTQHQSPENGLVYSKLAFSFEKNGEIKKARQYYRKSIELSPNMGEVHNNYGAFLCRQGSYKQSLKEFDHAAKCPNYSDIKGARENKALCSSKAGIHSPTSSSRTRGSRKNK